MKSFIEFIREQGVVGFATGFILGGAVSDLVKAFINDLVNPFIGLTLGSVQGLKTSSVGFFGAHIAWGDFAVVFINFLVLAGVVFFAFKVLQLEKLDKPKAK
ncbi:MscL family protein [Candidatus Kaiserbacteria bacterium]|nr:MscL family protein [Candidatus Kaiserbacteria bacterium]